MTETSTSRGCSFKLGLQVVDCVALLLVLVLQGSILDYYLILHNGGSAAWYFWFLADFLVLIAFMAAAVISYRHYQKKGRLIRKPGDEGDGHQMTGLLPPSRQGSLPLSYVTWFFYSSLLTAKVVLLFKLDVAQTLEKDNTFGPQLLKIVIASAAIVFLLLVETHNDAEPHSDHQAYIYFLITSTVFEILDSVTFLGILFPNESKLVLMGEFENAILGLSCINFVLPTLALYKLSVSEFGLHARPLGLQLLYKILHLVLINVPYLAIRIYLWTLFDQNVTLFVLKNILSIFLALRTTFPDIQLWWQIFQESRRKHHACLDGAMELGVVYETAEEHMMEEVNFGKDVPKKLQNTQL